jgi:hypothetical protein
LLFIWKSSLVFVQYCLTLGASKNHAYKNCFKFFLWDILIKEISCNVIFICFIIFLQFCISFSCNNFWVSEIGWCVYAVWLINSYCHLIFLSCLIYTEKEVDYCVICKRSFLLTSLPVLHEYLCSQKEISIRW